MQPALAYEDPTGYHADDDQTLFLVSCQAGATFLPFDYRFRDDSSGSLGTSAAQANAYPKLLRQQQRERFR